MTIVDELIAVLGYEVHGEEKARAFEKRLDAINRKLVAFSAAATRAASVGAAALTAGLGMLGRNVINTSAQFEAFETTLITIEGSADRAKKAMSWIAEFGKTTPYEVAQVTEAFVRLKAYGIDPIADDTLRTLGDTASAMGKPLMSAVEAIADAATGEFERMKEFGLKAKQQGDEVTFSWSKNGKDVSQTVKKTSEDIRGFILQNFGERFGGAMDRQSKTWVGMWSNLVDWWTAQQKLVGDKGFFDYAKGYLGGVLAQLDRLSKNGDLDRWAQQASDVLTYAAKGLAAFAEQSARHIAFIADNWSTVGPVMANIGIAFGLFLARAMPVTTAMIAAALAVDDFLTYLQGGDSVIGDFVDAMSDMFGVSESVAQSMTGLAAAVGAGLAVAFIARPLATMKTFAAVLIGGVLRAAPLVLAAIGALFTPAGLAVAIVGAGAALVAYFWGDITTAWGALSASASALFASAYDWFASIDLAGAGAAMMSSLWAGMKRTGGNIRDWATNLFSGFGGAAPKAAQEQKPVPGAVLTPEETRRMMENLRGNSARFDRAPAAGIAQDNRSTVQTNNIQINQTVTEATQAAGAAARATGSAVAQAAQRSQIEMEPAR